MAGLMDPNNAYTHAVDNDTAFLRATKLTQETFLIFREGLNDSNNMFFFADEGNVIMSQGTKSPRDANMAADDVYIYDLPHTIPYGDVYDDQIKRTVLMIFQCMDSTVVMAPMIARAIGPFCTSIEDVHFQPKNEALWAHWEGVYGRVTHYILRATLGSGVQYAIDLTSPQYNWHDDPPVKHWDWYVQNRVASLSFCTAENSLSDIFRDYVEDFICDFDNNGNPIFPNDFHRNSQAGLRYTWGRFVVRRDFEDGILEFETRHKPLAELLTLPEWEYHPWANHFLNHMRNWVASVPQRWEQIRTQYGWTGPVANKIRQRRTAPGGRGYGHWVDAKTGIRMTENEAYSNWMHNIGRSADDPNWGFLAPAKQPGQPPALRPSQQRTIDPRLQDNPFANGGQAGNGHASNAYASAINIHDNNGAGGSNYVNPCPHNSRESSSNTNAKAEGFPQPNPSVDQDNSKRFRIQPSPMPMSNNDGATDAHPFGNANPNPNPFPVSMPDIDSYNNIDQFMVASGLPPVTQLDQTSVNAMIAQAQAAAQKQKQQQQQQVPWDAFVNYQGEGQNMRPVR